ncbi:hypothetical protein HY224_00620 [Candidatus Uhrbacteria bacterium]|nr:hypothetical protein [Candidatus Uhrbacteria bacterium]
MDQGMPGQKCSCPHHKVPMFFVIVFGLLFLLESLGVVTPHATNIAWPIIVILFGLNKLFSGACKCC